MSTITDIGSLISQTPGVCGGRPCIAGTAVSVRRIAGWYKQGLTPEEIATEIPHLSLAQIHAALAYYHWSSPPHKDERFIRSTWATFAGSTPDGSESSVPTLVSLSPDSNAIPSASRYAAS